MILIIVLTAFVISCAVAIFTGGSGPYYCPGTVVKYKGTQQCGVIAACKYKGGRWYAQMLGCGPGWIPTKNLIKP